MKLNAKNNFIRVNIVYKERNVSLFNGDSVYKIHNFNGDIRREFYFCHRWDGTGYVEWIRTSSSKHSLCEKLDFLRFLVSKSLKHFCFLFYQVFPGILTLKTNILKLVNPIIGIRILTIGNWQTEKSTSLCTNKSIII